MNIVSKYRTRVVGFKDKAESHEPTQPLTQALDGNSKKGIDAMKKIVYTISAIIVLGPGGGLIGGLLGAMISGAIVGIFGGGIRGFEQLAPGLYIGAALGATWGVFMSVKYAGIPKRCSQCHKLVSALSAAQGNCPHCGAYWRTEQRA